MKMMYFMQDCAQNDLGVDMLTESPNHMVC